MNNNLNGDRGPVGTGKEVQDPYCTNFLSSKDKGAEKKLNKESENKKFGFSVTADPNKNASTEVKMGKNNKLEKEEKELMAEVGDETLLQSRLEEQDELEKVAIDILSKFRDEEKYPEFYNATIVFMSPKFVADYQGNLDNVGNYREMNESVGKQNKLEEKNKKLKMELNEAKKQIVDLKKKIEDSKGRSGNFKNKLASNKQKEKVGKIDNPRPNSCDKVSVLSRIKSIYDRIKNEPNSETNIHLKEKEDK